MRRARARRNLPEIELTPLVESGQYKVDAAKIADQMIGRILADKLK